MANESRKKEQLRSAVKPEELPKLEKPLKRRAGKPKIGQPISIAVYDDQRAFLDSLVTREHNRSAVVRELIQRAMDAEADGEEKTA